jgi:hypothetical protein
MARSRTYWPAFLASLLVITQAQSSRAENPKSDAKTYSIEVPSKTKDPSSKSKHKEQETWRVYRLDSPDPNFGQWVADTIHEMIPKDKPGTVKYYAPGRILAVYHNPSVQAEVEAFLENLKEALPQGKEHLTGSIVKAQAPVPARFPISFVKATEQGTSPSSGLANQQPRHLVHVMVEGFEAKGDNVKLKSFTFRYEGEGIIDSNLAWLIKSLNEQNPGQETGKPALNTADLTRYIKDLLGAPPCRYLEHPPQYVPPSPAFPCPGPEARPNSEDVSKAAAATKAPDRQSPEESSPSTSTSAPAPKPEQAPAPKPANDGPPPTGRSAPIP